MTIKQIGASAQPTELRLNFRFASAEIKKGAKRRAKAEGRTLTAHINEVLKQDAAKHPAK